MERFLFDVIGAVGDSICTEPVVRYAIKQVKRRGAEAFIMTNHPQIFKHLGLPMGMTLRDLGLEDGKPFTHFFNRHEMATEQGIQLHRIIEHAPPLLVHCVDFVSMLMLRRILPDSCKRPFIEWKDTSVSLEKKIGCSLNRLVLLHPGTAAKTDRIRFFPDDYCQELIDELCKRGLTVAHIGKRHPDGSGAVKVNDNRVIDLVDLGWEDFVTVIAKAPVLITNDSAPVHIASMFDNHIVLIPTIRHPDRLLHLRNGSRYHKAAALYKKLVLDDEVDVPVEKYLTNCVWHQQVPKLRDYLPEPTAVAEKALLFSRAGVA
jgi:hypothetical protein